MVKLLINGSTRKGQMGVEREWPGALSLAVLELPAGSRQLSDLEQAPDPSQPWLPGASMARSPAS